MRFYIRKLVCLVLLASGPYGSAIAQRVDYQRPTSTIPTHQILYEDWQKGGVLEGVRDHVFPRFGVERTLSIRLRSCGQSNAYYVRNLREIVLCYELIDEIIEGSLLSFRGLTSAQLTPIIANAFSFILLHEFGHAVMDIKQILSFGREEDNADQIAAYMLLKEVLATQPANVADASVYAIGSWFNNKSSQYISRHQMAGEHSLPQQRVFNIACLAIGSDLGRYQRAAKALQLPMDRAVRCGDEWSKVQRAYWSYEDKRERAQQPLSPGWTNTKP